MTRIRRTSYAFFYLQDDYLLDLASVVRGELPSPGSWARILALAILTGERHELLREELDLLSSVPADRWVSAADRDDDLVRALIEKGLLVSDGGDRGSRALRERDEALSANAWNLYAAVYHYMTQRGAQMTEGDPPPEVLAERISAATAALVAQYGPPPAAIAPLRGARTLALPAIERDDPFYRLLTERRTTRAFHPARPLALDQFDTVLRYVFGCHGYVRGAGDSIFIKRTSPSGGCLHPIEVYPIVSNVVGVPAGIYQYNVRGHTLTLLIELAPSDARHTATSFMCGQNYFGGAHVSCVLTARFYRNHWKYRRHDKAYAAILMDAAHLTQTLQLVSGHLGLGSFVTIAINGSDIEERLGCDGVSEGVIAMAGFGIRAAEDSPLEARFAPWPPA